MHLGHAPDAGTGRPPAAAPAGLSGRTENGRVSFLWSCNATYAEASHKPSVIAAMILMTRFDNPAAVLGNLLAKAAPRRAV